VYSRVVPVVHAPPDGLHFSFWDNFAFNSSFRSLSLSGNIAIPFLNISSALMPWDEHSFVRFRAPQWPRQCVTVKTKSNIGYETVAFERERVYSLCYSGPMEFYREIFAHRVCGPETLGSYGLSNIWATGHAIVISLKKESRPHNFDPRQFFRVIHLIFYRKHHHKKYGNEK